VKFVKTSSISKPVDYLRQTISGHLNAGENVLWLCAGGSVAKIAANLSHKFTGNNIDKLYVSLTDERFVRAGDADSNWQQMVSSGFKIPDAKLYPVLDNSTLQETTDKYDRQLKKLFLLADYKIALFGMGADGHIAALFPNFPQLREDKLYAVSLNNSPKPPPNRITMTFEAIKNLDEAVIFAAGDEKLPALEKLQQQASAEELPAQFLKKLPKLTIFNDRIGEEI
jgi:6-phosphogluconolactonase